MRLPKAVSLILRFGQRFLEKGMRRTVVGRVAGPPAEIFRTDAKAQGSELWVGCWCCADHQSPSKCRWFPEKIDHVKFPIFSMAGQPYRSIASLELLSTLIGILLFKPEGRSSGVNVCSAATDNRGNSFVTARWLTTAFPLNAILMEMAAVLQERSLMLKLHWVPLADALTNEQYGSFDESLRLRFDFSSYQSVILDDIMRAGSELYGDIKQYKEKFLNKKAAKLRKGQRLRDLEPWK